MRVGFELQHRDIMKLPHWRISQSFVGLSARHQALSDSAAEM